MKVIPIHTNLSDNQEMELVTSIIASCGAPKAVMQTSVLLNVKLEKQVN